MTNKTLNHFPFEFFQSHIPVTLVYYHCCLPTAMYYFIAYRENLFFRDADKKSCINPYYSIRRVTLFFRFQHLSALTKEWPYSIMLK